VRRRKTVEAVGGNSSSHSKKFREWELKAKSSADAELSRATVERVGPPRCTDKADKSDWQPLRSHLENVAKLVSAWFYSADLRKIMKLSQLLLK